MFQDEYKKAYNQIEISQIKVGELQKRLDGNRKVKENYYRIMKPIAVSVASLCLFFILALPILAEQIPAVYQVIQKFAPDMVEYILPEEFTCTNSDITLQVEAVNVEGNAAEIILSFKDAKGSKKNQIDGRVDLYDSYRMINYGENMQIGGCSFLEYDALEDKAYFKVDLTSDIAFQEDKVKIVVNQLLTRYENEEHEIHLEEMIENPEEKTVQCSGISGMTGRIACVMDLAEQNAYIADELYVTGVSYDEGVLRVQQCRGNFQNADRHIRLYLKDQEGNERIPDASVSWQEEWGGEKVLFEETWFMISEQELKMCELYGVFYISDNSVNGAWEVVVNLEEKF